MFSVIDTNYEACKAKRSLVQIGYIKDEFLKYFVKEASKKEILINRGYWSRVYSIKRLISTFLMKFKEEVQIISLGAGFDTNIFSLLKSKENMNFKYIEVDLEEVVKTKINIIKENKELNELIMDDLKIWDSNLFSKNYDLLSCNLKNIELLEKKLFLESGLDKNKPTLIFSECVLVYLNKEEITNLLKFSFNNFNKAICIDYEMFNSADPFGKQMVNNFKNIGIPLEGIEFFNNLDEIKENYKKNFNIDNFEIYNMKQIYYDLINKKDREVIEKLEWFDELEEFFLIQSHYFISISSNFNNNLSFKDLN